MSDLSVDLLMAAFPVSDISVVLRVIVSVVHLHSCLGCLCGVFYLHLSPSYIVSDSLSLCVILCLFLVVLFACV